MKMPTGVEGHEATPIVLRHQVQRKPLRRPRGELLAEHLRAQQLAQICRALAQQLASSFPRSRGAAQIRPQLAEFDPMLAGGGHLCRSLAISGQCWLILAKLNRCLDLSQLGETQPELTQIGHRVGGSLVPTARQIGSSLHLGTTTTSAKTKSAHED